MCRNANVAIKRNDHGTPLCPECGGGLGEEELTNLNLERVGDMPDGLTPCVRIDDEVGDGFTTSTIGTCPVCGHRIKFLCHYTSSRLDEPPNQYHIRLETDE